MADRYEWVDEQTLDNIDRLGLAYCRLNSWQWDEIVGEKPKDFDSLPNYKRGGFQNIFKKQRTKHDYIKGKMEKLISVIGEENASRCWWKFEKIGTEEEWLEWYLNHD